MDVGGGVNFTNMLEGAFITVIKNRCFIGKRNIWKKIFTSAQPSPKEREEDHAAFNFSKVLNFRKVG